MEETDIEETNSLSLSEYSNNENNENDETLKKPDKLEKKQNLFSFTKMNKYFIFPFLSPIFIFIRDYLIGLAKLKDDNIKATFQYEIIDGFMHSICGLFFFCEYHGGITEKKYLKIFSLILIIGLSYTIYISNSKIFSKKYTVFEIRIYHLIFNTIFCKLILKDDIFRHQILSIILSVIGWIFISIPIFQKLNFVDIIPNIIFFGGAIFYPLYLVFFKYIILKYYLSVFINMFFIGIFLLILSIIGLIIYSLIDNNDLSYLKDIFNIAENNILFYISIVFGIIVKIIFCLIISNFSPNIFVLTNVISSIINWIFNYLILKEKEESITNLICQGIGYFIILFSTLIYNEFIVLNFFGLNLYVRNAIVWRITKEEGKLKIKQKSIENNNKKISDYKPI